MSIAHFDLLIIGAGLSGIGTASRLKRAFPDRSIALLERRQRLGGTWDLFRYPGVRSDSDMYSYAYTARPWHSPQVLADGPTLWRYLADTARDNGIDKLIRYGLRVLSADWSATQRRWTIQALHEASGETHSYSCDFLIAGTGYYDYDAGYQPTFPGEEDYQGLRVHPQHWPQQLDYSNKRIVVIGSGATAISLVPALAASAAQVTMLQRSPTYVVMLPATDRLSKLLARVLPAALVYRFARQRYIWMQRGFFLACKRWPTQLRKFILGQLRQQLGNNIEMRHFSPDYPPWDQRVCVVPDGDLFTALKSGKASVVSAEIDRFVSHGIRLRDGSELPAEIIVSATGLRLQVLGGIELSVDGVPRELNKRMTYKGVLAQDLPNFATIFGGGNVSWTIKAELAADYLCRLLAHMQATGKSVATPHDSDDSATDQSILDLLKSGYVLRDSAKLPRQGRSYPWLISHHLGRDRKMLLDDPIEDRWLRLV